MNLTRNEQGVIELNGEPLHEWYTKRGIIPCKMRYAEQQGDVVKMCLIAAMGFAHVEAEQPIDQYIESLRGPEFVANVIGKLTGDGGDKIHHVELGFLSRPNEVLETQWQVLGYDSQVQLTRELGSIALR